MRDQTAGKNEKKETDKQTAEMKKTLEQIAAIPTGNIVLGLGVLLVATYMRTMTAPETQEISFQHFNTQLLAKDVVDRIEVANKTTAKVCSILGGAMLAKLL